MADDPMTREELIGELTRFQKLYAAQLPAVEFAELFQRAYTASRGYVTIGQTQDGVVVATGIGRFGMGDTAMSALAALVAKIAEIGGSDGA